MMSTSLANSSSASTSAYSAQVAFSTTSNAGESASGPIVRRREFRWCRRASASPDLRLSRRTLRALGNRLGLLFAPGDEFAGQRRIVQREHTGGEQRGIDGAGLADGQRPNRNPGRHLDDGIERIDARQRLGFDGNTEYW